MGLDFIKMVVYAYSVLAGSSNYIRSTSLNMVIDGSTFNKLLKDEHRGRLFACPVAASSAACLTPDLISSASRRSRCTRLFIVGAWGRIRIRIG